MMKRVLHLPVSKQWFDWVVSGEKTEVYREVNSYWVKRLITCLERIDTELSETIASWLRQTGDIRNWEGLKIKDYTHVLFTNGYGNGKLKVEKEIESISLGKPNKGWCPNEGIFVIKFKPLIGKECPQ